MDDVETAGKGVIVSFDSSIDVDGVNDGGTGRDDGDEDDDEDDDVDRDVVEIVDVVDVEVLVVVLPGT